MISVRHRLNFPLVHSAVLLITVFHGSYIVALLREFLSLLLEPVCSNLMRLQRLINGSPEGQCPDERVERALDVVVDAEDVELKEEGDGEDDHDEDDVDRPRQHGADDLGAGVQLAAVAGRLRRG